MIKEGVKLLARVKGLGVKHLPPAQARGAALQLGVDDERVEGLALEGPAVDSDVDLFFFLLLLFGVLGVVVEKVSFSSFEQFFVEN